MKNRELKSLKLIFKNLETGNLISISDLDNLIKATNDTDIKNFLRGCKHILERHYTEAIKWFQLADSFDESILLILFSSLKIKDSFLYEEYKTDKLGNFKIFKFYNFYPFIVIDNKEIALDLQMLNRLEEKYL